MFRIRAMQVKHGDSLLVSYGDDKQPFHLLVDGGPTGSLLTLLSVLKPECVAGRLRLEALVVTHYDRDHIQGVIELLSDLPSWLEVADVWFNGRYHMQPSDSLGPSEGDVLSKLIRSHNLLWNEKFRKSADDIEGGAVLQSSKAFFLAGELDVRVLSPDSDGLAALAGHWSNLDSDSESIPGDLLGRGDEWPPKPFSPSQVYSFNSDTSIPNRSSIALLLTFENKRVLLAGDAFSDVIKKGLAKHLPGGDSIDLLKVSHHGSKGNTDIHLLKMLRCRRFLISTNGMIHKHPDHAVVERLVASYDNPEIFFNYGDGWPGNWKDKPANWPPFTVRYPKSGDRFVDVFL